MSPCPECAERLPAAAERCGYCGARLHPTTPDDEDPPGFGRDSLLVGGICVAGTVIALVWALL